jgi:hypothetical protein
VFLDDLRWSDIRISYANGPRDCTAFAEASVVVVLHTWPIGVVSYHTGQWERKRGNELLSLD